MRNALLAQPPNTAWLVATGTLTNIGLLFATFPEVAGHIQGLSIMGGAVGEGFTGVPMSRLPGEESRVGNTTPWAEFNIYVSVKESWISKDSSSIDSFLTTNHSVTQKRPNLFSRTRFLAKKRR